MNKLAQWLAKFQLDVELLVWIYAVCCSARSVLSPHLAEAKMRQVYGDFLPSANDTAAVQRFLNSKMVLWEQRVQLIQLPLACASSMVLGAFSDRFSAGPSRSPHSRLWLILLGLFGSCIDILSRLLVWTIPTAPLWLLLISAALVGFLGGGNFLFLCASNARIVDKNKQKEHKGQIGQGSGQTNEEKNEGNDQMGQQGFGQIDQSEQNSKFRLSSRMLLFSAAFSIGALLGAQLAGQLAIHASHQFAFASTLVLLFASIPLAILLVRQAAGANGENGQIGEEKTKKCIFPHPLDALRSIRMLPADCWAIIRHSPLPFFLCLAGLFLCNSVFSEENELFGIYTRLGPFYWETGQLSLYKSIRPITQLFGMALGAVALRWGCLSEFALLQMGALSLVGVGLCVAFASNSVLLFASLAAGAPHGLFTSMAYTLFAQISPSDKAGTLFALLLIVERLAHFFQSQLLQSIYRLTLNWHQQFIWLLVSALAALASGLFALAKIGLAKNKGN